MTQINQLKAYFKANKAITQLTAMRDMGILRLSERIREMERSGWSFEHNTVTVPTRSGKPARVTEYVLRVEGV